MDSSAKKVSIAIIVVLMGVIGALWYVGNKTEKKESPAKVDLLTATSTTFENIDVSAYVAGRESLEEIIQTKLGEIANGADLPTDPSTAKVYTYANLIISNNTSVASLKSYGEQIAKALAPYGNDQENEIAIMLTALEQKSPVKAAEVAARAKANVQILAGLLRIAVPKTAANAHLHLVNNLSRGISLLSDMSKVLDNPNLALQSADLYRLQKIDFYKAIEGINAFFKENNINFTGEEGGKIYVNI